MLSTVTHIQMASGVLANHECDQTPELMPTAQSTIAEITACQTCIQNRMRSAGSVRVSVFVKIIDEAKPNAENAANSEPVDAVICNWPMNRPGSTTSSAPMKPTHAATTRQPVSRSPRNTGASTATHSGEVNSSANNSAIGIKVSA